MTRTSNPGAQMEQQQGARWGQNGSDPSWWFDSLGRFIVNTDIISGGPDFVLTHPAYGGIGDNATDNTAGFTLLMNDVLAAGGGRVYLPAGTYKFSAALLRKHSNVEIYGDGKGLTIVSLAGTHWLKFGTSCQITTAAVAGATTLKVKARSSFEGVYSDEVAGDLAVGDAVRIITVDAATELVESYHNTTIVSNTPGAGADDDFTVVIANAIPAGKKVLALAPIGTTVSNITFRDLTVLNNGAYGDAYAASRGIIIRSSTNTSVINCHFEGCAGEAVSWPSCWGGRSTEQFNASVLGCTFTNCGHDAVNPWQMDGFLCEDNHFYQCLTGVENLARNAIIQGNEFRECGGIGALAGLGYGVFVGSANRYQIRNVVVANNTFKDMDGRAVLISRETLYVNVVGNVILNVDTVAVEIRNNDITGETMVPQYIKVANNQIINPTTAAVFLEDTGADFTTGPHHVQIHGNTFVRGANGGVGILIDPSCTDVNYWGNSFPGYTAAQQVQNDSGLVPAFDVPSLSLGPNVIRRAFAKTSISDNVATGIFTITTTNETGDNDAGGYACRIHVLGQDGTYTALDSASMETEVAFARAMVAAGTGVNSAVAVIGSTACAATNAANRNIDSLTVTVTETSEYVMTVNVTIDHSGALAAALSAVVIVELLWYGLQTAPTLAAA